MKRFLKRLALPALLLVALTVPAFGQTRIATVSMQKVSENYWRMKQRLAVLKERKAEMEKTARENRENLVKAKEEYVKLDESINDQAVSATERERRKKAAVGKLKEIRDMETQAASFERQAVAALTEQWAQLRKRVIEEVKPVIASKAKAGNYTLVLDSDAQSLVPDPTSPYVTPTVLFSASENDLTDAVLAELNAGSPVDVSQTTDKPKTDEKTQSVKETSPAARP